MKVEEPDTAEPWHQAPSAIEDPGGFLLAWGRRGFGLVAAIAIVASLTHAVWSYIAHGRVTAALIVDGTIVLVMVAWAIWSTARNARPRTRA